MFSRGRLFCCLTHRVGHVCKLQKKVIAINVENPLAKVLDDISDVEDRLPGYVSGIREWFRWYKTPDGKPLNLFGFGEKALDKVGRRCRLFCFCCPGSLPRRVKCP